MAETIFYSWQSDLPNSTNRSFIQTALERAIEGVLEENLELDLALDRDTQGVPGAPDIAETIIQKINQASVFVADVSIINSSDRGVEGKRLTPNPNVLFELGYAAAKISWENIVLVHNLATGSIEDLPFDIRFRRPIIYSVSATDAEKSESRRLLQRDLQRAILASVEAKKKKKQNLRFFYKRDSGRFGIENKGLGPIRINRFVYEFPQSVHVNSGAPIAHYPITFVSDIGQRHGGQYWRLTLVQKIIGNNPGNNISWMLPEFISSGEVEVFRYPASFIKETAATEHPDAEITLKLYLEDGGVFVKTPTIRELFDPNGDYAPITL